MRLLAACVALAALSLVLGGAPTYDPWAWILWGREVAALDLNTVGGPSWKPLPVLFTTAFAPLAGVHESLPPALWLVVARAGALLMVVTAFRVARRLAGPSPATATAAGLLAAVAVVLTPHWLRNAAHGNEVPLAMGLLLWGVDRHMDGQRAPALVLAFLSCLLRPEVFPFLVAYGAWLWRAEPGARRLTAGLAVTLPLLWLVPEWIGSGDPLSASSQARGEPPWSLSLTERPWLAALERAHQLAGLPVELGAGAAAGLAWRRRSAADRVTLALAGIAFSWLAVVVAMVEAGFTGSPRYFLPAVVILGLLAAVGAARLVDSAPGPALTSAMAAVALVAVVGPWALGRAESFERQAKGVEHLSDHHGDLLATVDRLGGGDAVTASGAPRVSPAFLTHMAWATGGCSARGGAGMSSSRLWPRPSGGALRPTSSGAPDRWSASGAFARRRQL